MNNYKKAFALVIGVAAFIKNEFEVSELAELPKFIFYKTLTDSTTFRRRMIGKGNAQKTINLKRVKLPTKQLYL